MIGFRIIVIGLFLIILASNTNYQIYGSEIKAIKGELTASCGIMPFGGEEVGSFELEIGKRGPKDWLESLKIWMKEPPEGEYIVGFMGIAGRPSKLPEALVKVDEYRSDGRVMITGNKVIPPLSEVLFVAERDPDALSTAWSLINITGTAYLADPIRSFPNSTKFEYKNAAIIHTLDIAKQSCVLHANLR